MPNYPSKEELYPEIVKAIREHGTGTFHSLDLTMQITIVLMADHYFVTFSYKFLNYNFVVPFDEVGEVAA